MSDSFSTALVPSFSSMSQEVSKWFFTLMADRVVERLDGELSGLGVYAGGRRNYTPGLSTASNRWGGIRWEMGK